MPIPRSISAAAVLLFAGSLSAQSLDQQFMDQQVKQSLEEQATPGGPKLDPKRIINESSGFLHEREPEMNAEEYAIYERVAGMLNTKPDFALKLLEAMINEKEPPSPAFQFILGNAYYSTGDNAKAEAAYRAAIDRYPTFLRAWSNLGVLYYTARRFDEAARCFAKCVSLGERDPSTYGLLGYSLEQQKKIVSAEMAYMQALSADPSNPDWLEGLLRIYVQGKQYGRAEWLVKDLIRERPEDTRFWLTYADILLSQGRKVEAVAVLEVCVATGVGGTAEFEQLAGLYAEQQLVPEAIGMYQRLTGVMPQLGEKKLLTFAEVLVGNHQLAEAERVFAALAPRVTPDGQGSFHLAHAGLLIAQKKYPPARAELEQLLQSEPRNGRALLSLGRVYLAEENLPRALLVFESAAQVPDTTYRASLELANLELKNRHYAKTVQHLERALAIEKTAPVQDLLARVRPLASQPD